MEDLCEPGDTMNKKEQMIFNKYNPADAVIPCPKGSIKHRNLLNKYAIAAVQLYGIISKVEFVEIFNSQNPEQTTVDEVFTLLLPYAIKDIRYCFYKEYLAQSQVVSIPDFFEQVLLEQSGKQRYIPPKTEFLKYTEPDYLDETELPLWNKLEMYILEHLDYKDDIFEFLSELKTIALINSLPMAELFGLFSEYGVEFTSEEQLKKFTDLYIEFYNNKRIWQNKGYSPNQSQKEIKGQTPPRKPGEITVMPPRKIGPNEPCPCGSGKKYKKCCQNLKNEPKSHLTLYEILLFFETWYGLLGFVNESKKIVNAVIKAGLPGTVSDEHAIKIREVLWKNPKLITEYLKATKLPLEKISLLESWRDYHLKAQFMVWKYTPEYTVMNYIDKKKQNHIYAVKGISKPISEVLQRELPVVIETVLLPFTDKIIFDSLIKSAPIVFTFSGDKKAMPNIDDDIKKHGIISRLA